MWTLLLLLGAALSKPDPALYGHFMIRRVSGYAVSMETLCADLDAAGVFHCHFNWRDGAAGKRHIAIKSDDELIAAVNSQQSVRAANATFTQVKDQYQLTPTGTYLGRAASWRGVASFPGRRLTGDVQTGAPLVLRYLNPLFYGGTYSYAPATKNVTVYVVDTEVLASHPEFAAPGGGSRVRATWRSLSAEGTTGTSCAQEHGTHVASIVVGHEFGVCKSATVVSVAVNAGCGADSRASELVAGLDWILSEMDPSTATVVAISPQAIAGGAGEIVTLMTNRLLDAGVVVVSAAGDASDVACLYSPSGTSGVLTVAGANMTSVSRGIPSETTNYGSCVGLWAAGVNVTAASAQPGMVSVFTGTASAMAAVAGTAAQLLASGQAADQASVAAAMKRFAAEDVLLWNVPLTPRTFAQVPPVYGDGAYGGYGSYGGHGSYGA